MLAKPHSNISKDTSNLLIEKRHSLKETVPTEKTAKCLPLIEEFRKKKEGNTERTLAKKDFQKLKKLSLPDLKCNKNSSQRLGAGESFDDCNFDNSPWHSLMVQEPYKNVLQSSKHHGDADSSIKVESKYGLSGCQVQFKTSSSDFQLKDLDIENKEPKPSNALKRWKIWVEDKKRIQDYVGKKIERDPCNLLMQESDKYRQIVEKKLLFEYAQLPTAGKWKTHPNYWEAELKLSKKQVKVSENVPTHCGKKSELEEGEIPELEFIGMPKSIQKEKGLLCNMKNRALKQWEKMPYGQTRQLQLKEQIKILKPHDVVMDNLEVIGKKICKFQKEIDEKPIVLKNVPEIKITSEEFKKSLEDRQSIFCLVVNGEEIKCELGSDCRDRCKMLTWNLNFGVNSVGTFVRKVLVVENRGTLAVSYHWVPQKNQQKNFLNSLLSENYEHWFYFNKNSGVFLPGQCYEFQFYLLANSSGIRKEIWNLNTVPPISKNVIVFSAVAVDNTQEENLLELFLCLRERDSVVEFILEVIFFKIFTITDALDDVEYRSIFDEKYLFEFHNPKYYYHSMIVKKLNSLLGQITNSIQQEWDLSLNSLISIIKTCKKGRERDFLLCQVGKYSKKLLRPNFVFKKNEKVYAVTYEILCKMVNLIDEDYICLKNIFFPKTEKDWREYEDSEEFYSNLSLNTEEMGKLDNNLGLVDCSTTDFFFFKMIFYIKVYSRVCEAISEVAGSLETKKLFKPWKQVNYNPKPPLLMNSLHDSKK